MIRQNPINTAGLALLTKASPDTFTAYERRFLNDMTNPDMQAVTQKQCDYMKYLAQKIDYAFGHALPIGARQLNGARPTLSTSIPITPRTPTGY